MGDLILVRDSKEPAAVPQRDSSEEWASFVAAVKAGEFDDLLGRGADPMCAGRDTSVRSFSRFFDLSGLGRSARRG